MCCSASQGCDSITGIRVIPAGKAIVSLACEVLESTPLSASPANCSSNCLNVTSNVVAGHTAVLLGLRDSSAYYISGADGRTALAFTTLPSTPSSPALQNSPVLSQFGFGTVSLVGANVGDTSIVTISATISPCTAAPCSTVLISTTSTLVDTRDGLQPNRTYSMSAVITDASTGLSSKPSAALIYTTAPALPMALFTSVPPSAFAQPPPSPLPTPPTASAITRLTPGKGNVTVAFLPPSSDGGSPLTNYTVTCVNSGGQSVSVTVLSSPAVVAGMADGVPNQCTVRANNKIGGGVPGTPQPVTPSATPTPPKSAPRPKTVTPGRGHITIEFDYAINDWGVAITGYTATCTKSSGQPAKGTAWLMNLSISRPAPEYIFAFLPSQ